MSICLQCGQDNSQHAENCPFRASHLEKKLDGQARCPICGQKVSPTGEHLGLTGEHHCTGSVALDPEVINDQELTTQQKIDLLFDNFKTFLKEKNIRYGDSAINPLQIFSKESANSQICNRLDDKLGRIKRSTELKKNDVSDMFGYIALLMIQNNWLEFEDLLD